MTEDNGAVSIYVLQVKGEAGGWDDFATISVPARTKRKTIIQKGLAEAGYDADEWKKTLEVRVLDEESARATPVNPDPRPAAWRIG